MGRLYSDVDLPHAPDMSDPLWQESVVLLFFDEASGLTGFLRVGSEAVAGFSQVHFDLATEDGWRYRHNPHDLPMRKEDRTKDGFAAGNLTWRIVGDEYIHVTAKEKDASVDLKLYDWYPSESCWNMIGAPKDVDIAAPNHYESSGRVEGRVTMGERVFTLTDALGHRDHSWGHRDVAPMRSFRWFAGTCGPELSFSALMHHASNGLFVRGGWVVRNGVRADLEDLEIISHVTSDGLTVRGGEVEMALARGERLSFRTETIDGFLTSYRSERGGPNSHIGVESMSKVSVGGLKGFCDFNIANLIAGNAAPCAGVREEWATLTNGLSRRPPRPGER